MRIDHKCAATCTREDCLAVGECLKDVPRAETRVGAGNACVSPSWSHKTAEPLADLPVAGGYESAVYAIGHSPPGHYGKEHCVTLECSVEAAGTIARAGISGYNLYLQADFVAKIFSLPHTNIRKTFDELNLNLYRRSSGPLLIRVRDLCQWFTDAVFVFKPKDMHELEYLCEQLGYQLKKVDKDASVSVNSGHPQVLDRHYTRDAKRKNQQRGGTDTTARGANTAGHGES